MKVKETLLEVYPDGRTYEELKVKGDLKFIEQRKVRDRLEYSNYRIYDEGRNFNYFEIWIPDPLEKDSYKDIYLKYQNGARKFMSILFDLLIEEVKDIPIVYKTKQPKEFELVKNEKGLPVWLKLINDDKVVVIIDFLDKEENLSFADKFMRYFGGKQVSFQKECGLLKEVSERNIFDE